MGQQNEIIKFEQIDHQTDKKTQKRKNIFNQYITAGSSNEECSLPNCKCPAQNSKNSQQSQQLPKDFKICSVCTNDIKNFRKNNKAHYDEGKFRVQRPQYSSFSNSSYQAKQIMEYQPKVLYYNAWSPPTQRCFIQMNGKQLNETQLTQVENNNSIASGNGGFYPMSPSPHKNSDNSSSNHEQPFDYDVDPRDRYQNFLMIKENKY